MDVGWLIEERLNDFDPCLCSAWPSFQYRGHVIAIETDVFIPSTEYGVLSIEHSFPAEANIVKQNV